MLFRSRLAVRGLSAEDHERIDRVVEREREALTRTRPGATISRNAVLVELLRESLARRLDGLRKEIALIETLAAAPTGDGGHAR